MGDALGEEDGEAVGPDEGEALGDALGLDDGESVGLLVAAKATSTILKQVESVVFVPPPLLLACTV